MINYRSATDTLRKAGFVLTNTCNMDGELYHDFNSRKKDASISLVLDGVSGSVKWAEITTRKWENGRYVPVNKKIHALQDLIDLLR